MPANKLKVLITGAAGRIGPHLVEPFQALYDLRTFDRQPVPGDPNTFLGDLQDQGALRRAMEGVDVLVHLAAQADEAPFVEVLVPNNVIGLYNTFEAAREAGVRRIVFASTVQTVGFYPAEHGTIQIEEPPRPVTLYGATKVLGETMGRYYHDKHGIQFVGIRIGAFQPYDSELLRKHAGFRNLWLSPRDAAGLFRRAIEKPDIGYALVFGTSITPQERLSRRPARELLDFEAQDDIAALHLDETPEQATP
jgi:uronate dehydrogenase